jgi:hypothetical protein
LRRSVLLPLLVFGVFLSICPAHSFASAREEALSRYEKLMSLLERSNLKTDASGDATERIGSIHEALTRTDYDTALRQIDSLVADLEKDRAPRENDLNKEARLFWFEFLLDIFQKLAVLGLLAFFLIQNSRWRMALKMNKVPNPTRFVWGFLAVFVSVIFRVLDLSRYGDSVSVIFDMQVVLAAVAGFLTGPFLGDPERAPDGVYPSSVKAGCFKWTGDRSFRRRYRRPFRRRSRSLHSFREAGVCLRCVRGAGSRVHGLPAFFGHAAHRKYYF